LARLALLVVAAVAHAGGDAIGRGDEVWPERVHELSERDHRAVRCEVDGGYDLTCPVADGRGDRVQLGRKLLVVDREALLTDLVELVAHRCASRVRRCPQRTLPRFWQSVTDAHKALGEGWVRDAERYQLDRTLIHIDLDELDPLPERDGTVPKSQVAKENTPATGSTAPSPQAALRRYALTYTNWQATSLPGHERQIASLAVGSARLAAEQTAASQSAAAQLASNHVQNKGVVLAIAPGEGPAHGQWVVVTHEQTTGTGPYAGLPPTPHVTLARTERLRRSWAVSEWLPQN
jgi:hypothetical protein